MNISFDFSDVKIWIDLVSGIAVALAGIMTGLWAYTKYVLERSLLPPVQFHVECQKMGIQGDKQIIQFTIHLRNLGTDTLVATEIRLDLRYIDKSDIVTLFTNPSKSTFGRLNFSRSLLKDLNPKPIEKTQEKKRGFPVTPYDIFVRPSVDQEFSFTTILPSTATFVLVYSTFEYEQKPSRPQRLILSVSRRLGLIQYSLSHVTKPHTFEKVFNV